MEYSGDVTDYDLKLLTIAATRGILMPAVGDSVNYVNAELLAKERGIEVIEKTTTIKSDFPNLISVAVETEKGKKRVYGILSVNREARIVKIDNFESEIIPEGNMLVYKNVDKPGVIGRIGTILGENGINIASFSLGRTKEEKVAIGVINADNEVPEAVVDSIRNMDGILEVKSVVL